MAVTDVCVMRRVTGENTPGRVTYTVTLKVTCSSDFDGPKTVLESPLTPKLGNHYSVGNDVDTLSICYRVGTPRRGGQEKNLRLWILDAEYEWNRENRPEFQPVQIEPFFLQTSEPVREAQFNGYFKVSGGGLVEVPKTNDKLNKGITLGPITNSAGVPVVPVPERQASKPGYRVRWKKKTWFDFGFFLNTINNAPYTMIALDTDGRNINHGQIIFQKTFATGTLRLNHAEAQPVSIYDRLWYDIMLEFLEDDHDHYETDRGLARAAGPGDPDGRGGTFSASDFVDNRTELARITDPDGNPLTEPVLFDGTGKPIVDPKPTDAIFLRWGVYANTNFALLPIGNIN